MSVLLRAKKKDDAKCILQKFLIKGDVFCSKINDMYNYTV